MPLQDGRAILAAKATDLGGGTWHYEYALYNMNLDVALSAFGIPQSPGANLGSVGFYAPPHHAPEPHAENYSNAPWEVSVEETVVTWMTESHSENPLANAVRFGSVYNFWFNAELPPRPVDATVGLFRTETHIPVRTLGPSNAPLAPQGLPLTHSKTRFLLFTVPSSSPSVARNSETALRIELISLHHVTPPYTGGPSVPFMEFEGQTRWVGPPVQYLEASGIGTSFHASQLQCEPHYQDWSTVGLLHVTGSAIVPSSTYEVENVAASCMGIEESCTAVSAPMVVNTTRWGDVETPYNPPSLTSQPDLADVAALVNKFRGAPGAPIKARALLVGSDANGTIDIAPDFSFIHIAGCVDAFRGRPYPHTIAECP